MLEYIEILAKITLEESKFLASQCHPYVRAVLLSGGLTKNVAMMRELQAVAAAPDWGAVPAMLVGQSMVGWVPEIPGMMSRFKPPTKTIEEFMSSAADRTADLISQIGPSRDTGLDIQAEKKTMDEKKRGVILGPFPSMKATGLENASLVPRRAVWEQHGAATDVSVRCIDDMLSGEQNETVGTVCSHRPTDVDAFVVQSRAVVDRFPKCKIQAFTSDFAKAYKQCTGRPEDVSKYVIGQWLASSGKIGYFIAFTLLFGAVPGFEQQCLAQ